MKTLRDIADFLQNHIIECEPNTGCGRCDEARKHFKKLNKIILKQKEIQDINFIKWYSGMDEIKIRKAYERYKNEILKIQ